MKYKVQGLVKITEPNGTILYGLPNHIPMWNFNDYTQLKESEVDFGDEESSQTEKNNEE